MENKEMTNKIRRAQFAGLSMLLMCFSSCAYNGGFGTSNCGPGGCGLGAGRLGGCQMGSCRDKISNGMVCPLGGCMQNQCGTGECGVNNGCGTGCGTGICGRCGIGTCLRGRCDTCCSNLTGWAWRKPNAVPETLPLGSTVRAHDQVMQTNAEAADFIFHRHDFVAQTAHLTPDAKDKIVEVAARLRSTPFPVLIERSENNSNPELDAVRRNIVAQILTDFGNGDAQQRTIVATPYGPGYTGRRAESMYYQHVGFGNNQNNNNGNNGGGFGGGGFGGGGGF